MKAVYKGKTYDVHVLNLELQTVSLYDNSKPVIYGKIPKGYANSGEPKYAIPIEKVRLVL